MSTALRSRTALYRLFDANGVLLYVGITSDPKVRWIAHVDSKPWFPQVKTFTIEWRDTRTDAEAAERQAILAEAPFWNVRDSKWRVATGPDGQHVQVPKPPKRHSKGTNRVTFRAPDDVWEEFADAAERAGSDRSALIRDFILWYLAKADAKLPVRGEVTE